MITSCSCSESRLSRIRPVTSCGSTPAAPLKSSSSSTVNRSCNGGRGDRSVPAGSEAASAAIARATATPIPSSAPSVVPGAWTHPSVTTGKTPSTAGSVPAPASASQTMSRCAWRTTVSASDDAGRSATTLPASIDLRDQTELSEAVEDVRSDGSLLLGAPWQRGQPGELPPHDRGFQPAHPSNPVRCGSPSLPRHRFGPCRKNCSIPPTGPRRWSVDEVLPKSSIRTDAPSRPRHEHHRAPASSARAYHDGSPGSGNRRPPTPGRRSGTSGRPRLHCEDWSSTSATMTAAASALTASRAMVR